VDVVVVHDRAHRASIGLSFIEHALDEAGLVLPRATFGDLDMTAAGQRLDFNRKHGDAVAQIFVINDPSVSGCGGDRRVHLTNYLFARFVHANDRKA